LGLGLNSQAQAQTVTYIHTDGLGSPVAKSDASGNLIANSRTRYEPYGMAVAGTATPMIGFTGHVNDADTGLTYMQQRYYDPVAGRFLSTDPVLTDYNSGASFNRYTYASNNPYRYIDPDGRSPIDVVFLAWDLGKLGAALYTGVGVGQAAADVAMSIVGVVSPVPGTGQMMKAAKVVDRVHDAGAATKVAKTACGKRVEDYTSSQKNQIKSENAANNGGQMTCEGCAKPVESIQNKKGVPTPDNQAQIHHTKAIKDGGTEETPGQVLCPQCHKNEHRNN
jgi:RHS repeat-associated protein